MERESKRFAGRSRIVLMVMLLGLGAVAARAFSLQVLRHAELSRLAFGRYLDEVKIPARRGHIHDRAGRPLAISVEVPSIFANPMAIDDPRLAAQKLAPILGLDAAVLYERLAGDRMFVWLKRQVAPEVAAQVTALQLPGIATTRESRRFYPNKELGAQVLGFTGVDVAGLEGIEKALDASLAGEPQVVPTLRDARGNAVLSGELDPGHRSAGAAVFLTLDLQIQHAAEDALAAAIRQYSAEAGTAIVLDVATAEVLAMAVEPRFNPNQAAGASPARRRNRAVTDMFEPASTLKPLVIAAALDAKVVAPDTKVFCENGEYRLSGHTIHDGHGRGWLDLTSVIKLSSNIGVAKVGELLGKKRLHTYLGAYGLGARTGLSFPGESPGVLRDVGSWSDLELATISFGQGVAVTALQLAAAYRTLAADGVYRTPTLVRRIEYADGRRGELAPAEERRVLRPGVARRVTSMMEAAVDEVEGTAVRAAIPGFRVAGKTGTAQKADRVAGGYSQDDFTAVFGGFVPAEAPRIVVVVAVDSPRGAEHRGGVVAAPVFAAVAQSALQQLGVVPSSAPLAEALLRARAAPAAGAGLPPAATAEEPVPLAPPEPPPGTMPSFLGLTARQAMERYAELGLGLEVELLGSGLVVRQEPPPGAAGEARRVVLTMASR